MRSCIVVLACALWLPGCPREAQDPEPGPGRPCITYADCNAGRECGELPMRACVDRLCEDGASLVKPCPGGGLPIPLDAGSL